MKICVMTELLCGWAGVGYILHCPAPLYSCCGQLLILCLFDFFCMFGVIIEQLGQELAQPEGGPHHNQRRWWWMRPVLLL